MITGRTWVSKERKIMKNVIAMLIVVLFTGSAFAGSCPMLAGKVETKIEEAKKLQKAGMDAHPSGDHAKSEELLNKALSLFKS